MLRKLLVTTCVGATAWFGMADTSDAQVRVYRGPVRTRVTIGAPRVYAPVVPMYQHQYVAPGYGYATVAPVVVAPAPRRVVVTPNRVRIAGPNGTIRIRR